MHEKSKYCSTEIDGATRISCASGVLRRFLMKQHISISLLPLLSMQIARKPKHIPITLIYSNDHCIACQEACPITVPIVADRPSFPYPHSVSSLSETSIPSIKFRSLPYIMDQPNSPNAQAGQVVSGSSKSSSNASPPLPDFARCSRCQRSLSISIGNVPSWDGAVRISINSYYCARCAAMVGYKR